MKYIKQGLEKENGKKHRIINRLTLLSLYVAGHCQGRSQKFVLGGIKVFWGVGVYNFNNYVE